MVVAEMQNNKVLYCWVLKAAICVDADYSGNKRQLQLVVF
jgi:hypothetical protein